MRNSDLPGVTGGLGFRLLCWWRRVRTKVAVMAWILLMVVACQAITHGQYTWDRGPQAVGDPIVGALPWWNGAVFYEVVLCQVVGAVLAT